MALSPYHNSDGSLNTIGALESLAILIALTHDRRDKIENILALRGGNGQILNYTFDENQYPPSYLLVKEFNNYYLYLAGTSNAHQWISHLGGCGGMPYLQSGVNVHAFFYVVWRNVIKPIILPLLGTLTSNKHFYLMGMSYGGILAFIAANDLAALTSPSQVECLSFGSPRGITQGLTLPQPAHHTRIAHIFDPVAILPLQGSAFALPVFSFNVALSQPYTHYGNGFYLYDDGQLVANPHLTPNLFDAATNLQNMQTDAHTPHRYFNNLVRNIVGG